VSNCLSMTASAASEAMAWLWGCLAQATSASSPAGATALPPAPKALYVVTVLGIIAIIVLAIRAKDQAGSA